MGQHNFRSGDRKLNANPISDFQHNSRSGDRKLIQDSAAKTLAINQLKPMLEPLLQKQGLQWADVQPLLDTIGTAAEVQGLMVDPMGKLQKMAERSAPLA